MAELFTNFPTSTLASGIGTGDTSLTVAASDGSKFPSPTGSDFFRLVLFKKATGDAEIVKCTARSTDTLTIARAQEGTTALALSAGDLVELRATAATFDGMVSNDEVQEGGLTYAADVGAADAYVMGLTPAITAYTTGMRVHMKALNTNTGASTLNIDSVGVKDIKKRNDRALEAGDIEAGGIYELAYDGTYFQLISPTSGHGAYRDRANIFTGLNTMNSGIDCTSGNLTLQELVNSGLIRLSSYNSGGTEKTGLDVGGATPLVKLYYDGGEKVRTSSEGMDIGNAAVTDTRGLKVANGRTGDGTSYVDLIGDVTYSSYGTRLVRSGTANGKSQLLHRGTGNLELVADEAAAIVMEVNATTELTISSTGGIEIGTTTDGAQGTGSLIVDAPIYHDVSTRMYTPVTRYSDVKASRAFNTTYQNTNAYPIHVIVSGSKTGGANVAFYAKTDASSPPTTVVGAGSHTNAAGEISSVSFFVMPNDYYRVDESAGGALSYWVETT